MKATTLNLIDESLEILGHLLAGVIQLSSWKAKILDCFLASALKSHCVVSLLRVPWPIFPYW